MDRLYFLCFIALTFLSTSLTFAQATLEAKIVFNKGDNYKFNAAGLKIKLQKGAAIEEGDQLVIKEDGLAVIKIVGHSVLKLEGGTKLNFNQLPEVIGEGKNQEVSSPAELTNKIGSILIKMLKESSSESLVVRSKDATLGVRGTKFLVSTDEDVVVAVNEGTVELESNGNTDFLTKSESMVVENGRNFTARQKLDVFKNMNWDVESQKTSKWKNIKKKFRQAYLKKREKWKANKPRVQTFKKRWEERTQRSRDKIKKLMNNPSVQKKIEEKPKKRKEFNSKTRRSTPTERQIDNAKKRFRDRKRNKDMRDKVRDRVRHDEPKPPGEQ